MDVNTDNSFLESYQLNNFSLSHLLDYINFMDKTKLMNFADALKLKVLDKIGEFDAAYEEELDVLCQLTDQSLTENGKRIIAKRMVTIVNRTSFMKKEENDSKSDCVLIDNSQHNIAQEELILESLFSSRISGKLDSESKTKSVSIHRSSANIYKPHEKCVILENLNGVKENIKKEISNSIKVHNSSISTIGSTSTGENISIKKEMPDSIEGYDSSFSTKCCINVSENGNSNIEEGRKVSSNFSAYNTHLSRIKRDYNPKASATEFVNRKSYPLKVDANPSSVDDSIFGYFSLGDLMNYDMDRMPSDELNNYANALKLRVLQKISDFEPSDKEELEILCKCLDGNHTDRNKNKICSRICDLVNKTIPNKQLNRRSRSMKSRYHYKANYRS